MKNPSIHTPVYALTLLLSAALLFSVQPMFAKMILPLLGGTPNVWNTSMLFFQVMLLGGYAYAHLSSKYMGVRAQAGLHLALLCVFVFALPFGIPEGWAPPADRDPTIWQLSVMTAKIGGPFFVIAASAPMLQRWFSQSKARDAKNPYFLYGASNVGSMAALLAYPVIVEPLLSLSTQAWVWKCGYVGLIALTALAAFIAGTSARKTSRKRERRSPAVTWDQRILWLVLAFIPSSLMLGVTTFVTTDVAAAPLLWILPLAMYVGTFIIVFARKPIIPRTVIFNIQAALIIAVLATLIAPFPTGPAFLILLHFLSFFFCALACHMEMAAARPDAKHLTEFYLVISLGGALGGFFNAIIAPVYFTVPIEYPLALVAALSMRYAAVERQSLKDGLAHMKSFFMERGLEAIAEWKFLFVFIPVFVSLLAFASADNSMDYAAVALIVPCLFFLVDKRWLFAALVAFILFLFPPGYYWGTFLFKKDIYRDRNFFGVIKVVDTKFGERVLLHGVTSHGTQALDPKLRLTPLSYYGVNSPVTDAFRYLGAKPGKQNMAVLGLGIGVTACFQKPGRHFDFFEIDPAVIKVAENKHYFTYLSDCGSPYDIIAGDGRLTLKDKPDHSYDLILLDAFTSDNIPAHLLTVEAIQMYMRKLKPGGLLIFNVSNNYLDIEPVLAKASERLGVPGYARASRTEKIPGTEIYYNAAHFFSFSRDRDYISYLEKRGWTEGRMRKGVDLWTDQFSNILMTLGNKTGVARINAEAGEWKTEQEKVK